MTSVTSKASHLSAASQQILDNISKKSETKLMQKEANITDKMLNSAWEAFGAYVARNLKSGRAITVPGFGVITFGAPFVKLDGVTNPDQRDLRHRIPVFLISKEFVKGLNIQTGICSGGNLRPFSMKGVISGLPQAKINFTDIGSGIGLDKDNTRICIERVIRELGDKAKAGKFVDMDIPNLGKLIIKNSLAAIEFQDFLINDTLDAPYNFTKLKKYGEVTSGLTFENLRKFVQQQGVIDEKDSLKIEQNAENWLKTNLNIDVNVLKSISRPQTAKATSEKNKFAFGSFARELSTSDAQSFISRPVSGTSSVRSSVRSSSSFFRMMKSSNTNEERTQYLVRQKAIKKIKSWLRKSNLQPLEAFNEIAKQVFGPSASAKSRLNYAEFKKSLLRLDNIDLDLEEIDEVIKTLDAGNSFVITFEQWSTLFQAPAGSYVDGIKETVIKKYNLQNPDILRRMNLSQDGSEQNLNSLKEALLNLDPTLSESQALKAAKELLGESDTISVDQLIKNLGCVSCNLFDYLSTSHSSLDDLSKEQDWYQTQLILLKRKIRDIYKLKQCFEKYDDRNQGLINTTNFKAVLQKFKLGFDSEYLYRFTRCVDKDSEMMIDFIKFCEILENLKIEEELNLLSSNPAYVEFDKFSVINDKLQTYLQSNNIQPKDLVATVFSKEAANLEAIDKVSIERFAQFLQKICQNIFPKSQVFLHFTKKIDLDADGFINQNDIETFIARNSYIKQSHLTNKNNLFPKVPLPEAKVEVILRDIRHELNRKKIPFYEFARKIDVLQTGFITINDFCKGIDKIIKLSQPVKDGFFAYIDTENIGIISYQDFINVLKRSVVDKPVDVTEDSFDWQVEILNMIKDYAAEKGLSADDTFRIMDSDFDGFVSQADLLRFLREVLNLTPEEATEPRIARLFKLLDFYKRGCIQLNDIKMLLNSKTNQTNPILSANDWMPKKSPFDWQLHARQQIGLALSQNFANLKASFQSIAGGNNENMKYAQFHKWIESNRILSGFNMTERLIQKLFADLDPHKKGYLSEIDWFNAFSGYDASQQMISEIQEVIASNYDSIENAYEFFLSIENQTYPSNTQVSYHGFQKALEALLPKRFTTQQITYLWNACSLDKKSLSLRAFSEKLNKKKFTGSSYLGLSKIGTATFQASKMTRPYTSTGFTRKTNKSGAEIAAVKEEMQKKLFDKLRQILLASNISVEKFFNSIDVDKSNDISNLEFINAIKSLNLGLNLTEIEDLLLYCDENHDGKINFQEFVKKFAPHLSDHRLFERAKHKLQKFKENIYSYMVSPKDAFLLYNEDRTGKLTYNQFNKLVVRLHQLAREEVPPFSIIKDLFDFLDIRRDGIIDMQEWMQSLSLIDGSLIQAQPRSSNFSQKRSSTINVKSLNKTFYATTSQPSSIKNAVSISEWECSKTYEDILKLIARNRKALIATFEDLKSQNVAIDPTKIKQVVVGLLESHGFALTNEQWLYLSKFAEKDGQIDYKFMLEVFKERLYLLHAHPKASIL